MVAKARSVSFKAASETCAVGERNLTRTSERTQYSRRKMISKRNGKPANREANLKNLFLVPKITEGTDIRNDEGDAKLIFRAHLAKVDAAVFEGQTAAPA